MESPFSEVSSFARLAGPKVIKARTMSKSFALVIGLLIVVFAQNLSGQEPPPDSNFLLPELPQVPVQVDEVFAEPSSSIVASPPFENLRRFQGRFNTNDTSFGIGTDLYSAPDFEGGLIVVGDNVAMKIGGYVKADFIYDFSPIDSMDSFITTSIPVGAPPRTNTRFHARQTRMSFDTRWASNERLIQIYVEGDFFGDGSTFRLRHAYGEVGPLLVGKTWTTFTDVSAFPSTLDFEGSVSSVNRRQALARWTTGLPGFSEDVTAAVAVEDPSFIYELPPGVVGNVRTVAPDFVSRIRYSPDWGQFQAANVLRIGGFQMPHDDVTTGFGWGFNFSAVKTVGTSSKIYSQIVFGKGIGSFRSLPDAAPDSLTSVEPVGMFGWMVGITHDWNEELSSNFTYAENTLDNAPLQPPSDVQKTTYLAVNLLWTPLERVTTGVEYLYGVRTNVDEDSAAAHRLQASFIFDLP